MNMPYTIKGLAYKTYIIPKPSVAKKVRAREMNTFSSEAKARITNYFTD